ncbi:inositol monophosphatase 2 [Drosophila guanche]|uniref:Inositol-1-monophosphatase n=1 Tax=Drosophila guanche TaxID=7266 RepID=A0A3B0J4L4_DROGU|nr:inositol monophosphatase 2 [Drosophila guanche]SPP76794.1 blast:Inositol monophosphatase 3 [Drosophila guanche]
MSSAVEGKQSDVVEELYNFIYPLAVQAGEILMEGYERTSKNVSIKGDFYDVVTDYDNKIEDFLMEQILARYPDHKFIGEEETAKNNNVSKELTDAPTWIIDPIDGTSNFIKQIPHVCVSIGLSINKRIVLGVINNPAQKKIFTAKLGQGAFCNGKPIRVSSCESINDANVAYEVSLLHVHSVANKHIKRIYHVGLNARRLLAYSCVVDELCMVAAGNLDAFYIEDMYPWDCAAGSLLVSEAGGVVTHPFGGPFDIMKPDLICAGTETLRKEIEDLLRKADREESVGGVEVKK